MKSLLNNPSKCKLVIQSIIMQNQMQQHQQTMELQMKQFELKLEKRNDEK
jgi:hypothetical protein